MVWKCQNEISPIFYYGISEKTNEKDLKIHNVQAPWLKKSLLNVPVLHFAQRVQQLCPLLRLTSVNVKYPMMQDHNQILTILSIFTFLSCNIAQYLICFFVMSVAFYHIFTHTIHHQDQLKRPSFLMSNEKETKYSEESV